MVKDFLEQTMENITQATPHPGSADLEGIDNEPTSWGNYPIDTLLIRHEQRSIYEVIRRISKNQFVMNPDFQRDFIWDDKQQSKLIESVIMRIPLPVFYLAEDSEGRMIVVDGLQRLSTFKRFLNNDLKLKLPDRISINGRRFDELTPKLKNRIEDCNLILYVIDTKVPERARLDIFERVNSGVPLSRQQMRNCLYMGPATNFLRDESKTALFLEATGHSLKTETMRDREFVNRFCAFRLLNLDRFRDMDQFLAYALKRMNENHSTLTALSNRFKRTLENNLLLFNEHAFRRHNEGGERRNPLNASLWDVMSTGLSYYPLETVEVHAERLRSQFYGLLQNEDFLISITRATNGAKPVRTRFGFTRQLFEDVFGAIPD